MNKEDNLQEEAVLDIRDLYYDYFQYDAWLKREKEREENQEETENDGCIIMQM